MAPWPKSWPWPPGFLPSVTPISCCYTALLHTEQCGGILPNNLMASFLTIWWHPSKQCGGILPNNPSAFCLPLYSSAFQQAFFLQDFFPQIHF